MVQQVVDPRNREESVARLLLQGLVKSGGEYARRKRAAREEQRADRQEMRDFALQRAQLQLQRDIDAVNAYTDSLRRKIAQRRQASKVAEARRKVPPQDALSKLVSDSELLSPQQKQLLLIEIGGANGTVNLGQNTRPTNHEQFIESIRAAYKPAEAEKLISAYLEQKAGLDTKPADDEQFIELLTKHNAPERAIALIQEYLERGAALTETPTQEAVRNLRLINGLETDDELRGLLKNVVVSQLIVEKEKRPEEEYTESDLSPIPVSASEPTGMSLDMQGFVEDVKRNQEHTFEEVLRFIRTNNYDVDAFINAWYGE